MILPRDVESEVKRIVNSTPVFDPWTVIRVMNYDPSNRVSRLLTQPELLSQLAQVCGAVPGTLSMAEVADRVWEELFANRTPVSENCRVILTTFNRLGLREALGERNLAAIRQHVAQIAEADWVKAISGAANLGFVGVQRGVAVPAGFSHREFLSLNEVETAAAAAAAGVEPPPPLAEADFAASSYSVLELSAGQEQLQQELLARLLPLAAKHQHSVFCEVQRPEALHLLCTLLQAPLPGLRWVVSSPMASLYPVLHQMVQHYPQVRLCGRWRTDMTDVYDIARRQLDHGGTNFLHGYSKASVPEQLVGRWVHMRSALSNVLTEKYKVLIYAGWRITTEDIERDAIALLQGS